MNGELVIDERRSFNRLVNELSRHLNTELPSMAIKTGYSTKTDTTIGSSGNLGVAIDAALSGTPLLLLDVRERPTTENLVSRIDAKEPSQPYKHMDGKEQRNQLIEAAKAAHEEWCAELLNVGLTETFDVGNIAYFRDVLFGDANPMTWEGSSTENLEDQVRKGVPLIKAIERAKAGRPIYSTSQEVPPATPEQVKSFTEWMVEKMVRQPGSESSGPLLIPTALLKRPDFDPWLKQFTDAMANLPDDHEKKKDSLDKVFGPRMFAATQFTNKLFNLHRCFGVNVNHLDACVAALHDIVRFDRLPAQNTLEGLMLLQQAWREYDIVMHLAGWYKLFSKILFFIALAVGVGIESLSSIALDNGCGSGCQSLRSMLPPDMYSCTMKSTG